jgi:hypothetical protein
MTRCGNPRRSPPAQCSDGFKGAQQGRCATLPDGRAAVNGIDHPERQIKRQYNGSRLRRLKRFNHLPRFGDRTIVPVGNGSDNDRVAARRPTYGSLRARPRRR